MGLTSNEKISIESFYAVLSNLLIKIPFKKYSGCFNSQGKMQIIPQVRILLTSQYNFFTIQTRNKNN